MTVFTKDDTKVKTNNNRYDDGIKMRLFVK